MPRAAFAAEHVGSAHLISALATIGHPANPYVIGNANVPATQTAKAAPESSLYDTIATMRASLIVVLLLAFASLLPAAKTLDIYF
ncbi:MAG TPA: hypothetical protein VG672_22875, partial [Bryobacteraceae bacterium]|nr:hypothetical protein [Bryobacteraceae bacterium]